MGAWITSLVTKRIFRLCAQAEAAAEAQADEGDSVAAMEEGRADQVRRSFGVRALQLASLRRQHSA